MGVVLHAEGSSSGCGLACVHGDQEVGVVWSGSSRWVLDRVLIR